MAQTLQAFLCLEVSSFHQYMKSPQVGSKLPKVQWSPAFEKVSLVHSQALLKVMEMPEAKTDSLGAGEMAQ